jgi:hypothetical protein
MMKDLEIAFTAKEITAFGGVSLLYKMLDNCHFKEVLSSVGLPQQGSNRGKSPEQLIYGLFTGVWCDLDAKISVSVGIPKFYFRKMYGIPKSLGDKKGFLAASVCRRKPSSRLCFVLT